MGYTSNKQCPRTTSSWPRVSLDVLAWGSRSGFFANELKSKVGRRRLGTLEKPANRFVGIVIAYEDEVYLVTVLVPSDTECLTNSTGRVSRSLRIEGR